MSKSKIYYGQCPQPKGLASDKNSFRRLKGPILASLATSAGSFSLGCILSWTSVALPDLKSRGDLGLIDSEVESWIGSVVALGALVSGPLGGMSMEKWGRKFTLLGISLPLLLGWLVIAFAPNPTFLIVGRVLCGAALGSLTLVLPVYITECTEERLRGAIASTFPIMWGLGIVVTNLAGLLKISWFWLSLLFATCPVLLFISMLFVPESPIFYIRSGQDCKARTSLRWLRSASDSQIQSEFETLVDSISDERNDSGVPKRFNFKDLFQRSALITIMLYVFQQFSGFNAVIFYMVEILEATGSGMDANVSAVIISLVNLIAVCITSALTDKAGRKVLLLISSMGITTALTALGTFFYMKEQNSGETPEAIWWLPLASLLLFMVSFSAGMGPMPFLLMGEILPSDIKGIVSSIGISVMWFLAFLITKTFEGLSGTLGDYGCFWMFASVSAIGFLFILKFVKETKGKTLDQIYKLYA